MITISDNIKLQEIKIEDQPKLMRLLESIYPPAYKHLWIHEDCSFYLNKFFSVANLKIELADQDAFYYFVIYKSNVVGIFRFVHHEAFMDNPIKQSTYLNRIYLGKEAQGKGVAQKLFDWAENKAKEKGDTLIWLKAMDTQKQALRFYEKQGYNYENTMRLDFKLLHSHLRGMHVMFKMIS